MFKNYLTWSIALSFERSCRELVLEPIGRESMIDSLGKFVHNFSRSLHTQDRKEESKFLFVALLCLRDCHSTLSGAAQPAGLNTSEIDSQYEVLHKRLEQLCLKASETEDGQMRMLG